MAMEEKTAIFLKARSREGLAPLMLGSEGRAKQDDVLAVEGAVALANRHRRLPPVVPHGREKTFPSHAPMIVAELRHTTGKLHCCGIEIREPTVRVGRIDCDGQHFHHLPEDVFEAYPCKPIFLHASARFSTSSEPSKQVV
jgi:hypothetical protein